MAKAQREELEPVPAADQYAGFGVRCIARILDESMLRVFYLVIFAVCALGVAVRVVPGVVLAVATYWLALPCHLAYFAVFTAKSGQTPGKRLQGIQVQTPDGEVPGVGAAWLRSAAEQGFIALGVLLPEPARPLVLADYLLVPFRKDRRAGHDLVAGTVVRHVPPHQQVKIGTALSLFLVLVCLVGLFPVRALITPWARQSSAAMVPTINMGESWIASGFTYRLREPAVGDIVAFRSLDAAQTGKRGRQWGWRASRVVGLAGDRMAIRGGQLWRSGQVVKEPWGQGAADYTWPKGGAETTIPQGYVMVLGDNRKDRADNEFSARGPEGTPEQGPLLATKNIRGQVVAIGLPVQRLRSL
jgi:signal peptidase I